RGKMKLPQNDRAHALSSVMSPFQGLLRMTTSRPILRYVALSGLAPHDNFTPYPQLCRPFRACSA
ncbi:MAG: hypothetical protein PUI49_11440, partial [Prevotellaceae bacterium]|nr:hypothetical protein [Prevotellaceae bacterium]MDY5209056.1 hypothetical protein [Prevotella sp.]